MSTLEWAAVALLVYLVLCVLVLMLVAGADVHAEDELTDAQITKNTEPKANVTVLPSNGGKPRG